MWWGRIGVAQVVQFDQPQWKEQRNMSSFAGPFGQLPVLEWEDKENEEVRQTVGSPTFLSTNKRASDVNRSCSAVLLVSNLQRQSLGDERAF
eukprot:8387789-Pyramimonas_sp.AAC.2